MRPGKIGIAVIFLSIMSTVEGCGAKTDLEGPDGLFVEMDGSVDTAAAEDDGDETLRSSTWIVRIGGENPDMALSVAEAAGGIIAAGYTMSYSASGNPDDADLWIVKLDPDGRAVWQKVLGGAAHDQAYAVIEGRDGRAIVAGSTASYGAGASDMWVVEMDPGGSLLGQQAVGSDGWDHAYCAVQATDGGLVLAGALMAGGDGFLKLTGEGGVEWHSIVTLANLYAIAGTADGGYAVAGSLSGLNIWIGKLDAGGQMEWEKEIGGVRYDASWAILETSDGKLIVAGDTEPFTTIDETWPLDMWIGKFELDGTLVWQRSVGGEGGDSANAVAECPNGDYVVAGTGSSFEGDDYDIVALRMDSNGNVLWQKMIGGDGYDEARSVAVTQDGGIVIAGSSSDDESGSPDVLVAKLGADGEMGGSCSLVRDAGFSSEDSRLPISESTLRASTDGEIVVQDTHAAPRDSGATPVFLCPE